LGGGLHAVRLGHDHAIVGAAPGGIAEGVVDASKAVATVAQRRSLNISYLLGVLNPPNNPPYLYDTE
jgi:hypothetical protein